MNFPSLLNFIPFNYAKLPTPPVNPAQGMMPYDTVRCGMPNGGWVWD